jgi:hypothetical protein
MVEDHNINTSTCKTKGVVKTLWMIININKRKITNSIQKTRNLTLLTMIIQFVTNQTCTLDLCMRN